MDPAEILPLAKTQYPRIKKFISTTTLIPSPLRPNLYLKMENNQITGSFKIRGATSKLIDLHDKGIKEVITASTGNHGLAVSTVAKELGIQVSVYVPESIEKTKEAKLKGLGVKLEYIKGDSDKAEIEARKFANYHKIEFVSPYNDPLVIAGQASIAFELEEQVDLSEVSQIYVTVGGGGMISGIGSIIKERHPNIEIIGCQPENSATMYYSIKKGGVVEIDHHPTLSDGSAGGIEEKSITFDLSVQLIDRFILITEEEIKNAIYSSFKDHNEIIEGSAAVALAAAIKDPNKKADRKSIVILCGGNISSERWLNIINNKS